MNTTNTSPAATPPKRTGKGVLLALIAVCVAPVIASYTAYYVLQPGGRINYGELVDPQIDLTKVPISPKVVAPALPGARMLPIEAGKPAVFGGFRGRWVMVVPATAQCDQRCQDQLYKIRQVRLTTGKHRDRLERLMLLTDSGAPASNLLSEHAGMWVAAVSTDSLSNSFPALDTTTPADHIYLIDPLGNLMMRFPVNADPSKMKKDMLRLLKASRVG